MSKLHASQLLTVEREGQNPSLLSTPLGDPILPASLSSCTFETRQLAGGSERKLTSLPTGARRVTVPRRMTGEEKQKIPSFGVVGLAVMVMTPHFICSP